MADTHKESASVESNTISIYRTAATIKGGRRFSFGALVVVGDRQGRVGLGYAKANQVPPAIEKAQKEANRKLKPYPLQESTLPHQVTGRFGSCKVRLVPASPGTGVIAGGAVRAVLEMVGVQDCLTKSFGSNNAKNLVKATLDGLEQLRAKSTIESLRGVELRPSEVEEAIERGKAFMPSAGSSKAEAPVNVVGDKSRGGRKGGKKRGRGKGKDQGQDQQPAKAEQTDAKPEGAEAATPAGPATTDTGEVKEHVGTPQPAGTTTPESSTEAKDLKETTEEQDQEKKSQQE